MTWPKEALEEKKKKKQWRIEGVEGGNLPIIKGAQDLEPRGASIVE